MFVKTMDKRKQKYTEFLLDDQPQNILEDIHEFEGTTSSYFNIKLLISLVSRWMSKRKYMKNDRI